MHELIDLQVSDLVKEATGLLRSVDGQSTDDVCSAGLRMHHSDGLTLERHELEAFLFETVYRHPRLIPVRQSAADRLRKLFEMLVSHPNRLPLRFRERAERVRIEQVVGEYLAGMTDSFCDTQSREASDAQTTPLPDW